MRTSLAALLIILPSVASAAVGVGRVDNWTWIDNVDSNLGATIQYITPETLTGVGNGTITTLAINPATDYCGAGTAAPMLPEETWTFTKLAGGTWSVTGSVSGAQTGELTEDSDYETDDCRLTLRIVPGTTPFATDDSFSFDIANTLDASSLSEVLEHPIVGADPVSVFRDDVPNWDFSFIALDRNFGNSTRLVVHPAGYAQLVNTTGTEAFNPLTFLEHQALPSPHLYWGVDNSHSVVAPYWSALQAKADSKLHIGVIRDSHLIVQWTNMGHRDDANANLTFQVVFHRNQNALSFHYLDMTTTSDNSSAVDGSMATVGTQRDLSRAQRNSMLYSYNSPAISAGRTVTFGLDQDDDWVPNQVELSYGTSTTDANIDGDDFNDGVELLAGRDPSTDEGDTPDDTDGDGIFDLEEIYWGLDAAVADSDADGMSDGNELTYGTNPFLPDSDYDGILDGDEDADDDGTQNGTETNATLWDTDGDGVHDGDEAAFSTDPLDNLVSRKLQIPLGTGSDWFVADTDGAGNVHILNHGNSIALLDSDGNVLVASTNIDPVDNLDRAANANGEIVVLPPESGSLGRTIVLNYGFGTSLVWNEYDFGQAALDGSPSDDATLLVERKTLPVPYIVHHVDAEVDSQNNIHVLYLAHGGPLVDLGGNFSGRKTWRAVHYLRLDSTGSVVQAPVELLRVDPPGAHTKWHPHMTLGPDDAPHIIWRRNNGYSRYSVDTAVVEYTKLNANGTPAIPVTQLPNMRSIDKAPRIAVSPNETVTFVYATTMPRISPSGEGGYSLGRGIYMQAFNTSNDLLESVLPPTQIVDEMRVPFDTPSNENIGVYGRVSTAADAGGNIHVHATEHNNYGSGAYWIFSATGERLVGPARFNNTDGTHHNNLIVDGSVAWILPGGTQEIVRFDSSAVVSQDPSDQLPAPDPLGALAFTSINPNAVRPNQMATVTVIGEYFNSNTSVSIGGVMLTDMEVFPPGALVGRIDTGALGSGTFDVVLNRGTTDTVTATGAFRVGERLLTASAVVPSIAPANEESTIVVLGTGFASGSMSVSVGSDATTGIDVVSGTLLEATVPALDAGTYDVTVSDGDQSVTLPGALTLEAGATTPLRLLAVTPSLVTPDTQGTLTLAGTGFVDGMTVDLSGTAATNVTVNDGNSASATVTLPAGTYDVTATLPGGASDTLSSAVVAGTLSDGNGGGGDTGGGVSGGDDGCGCASAGPDLLVWAGAGVLALLRRRRRR